MFLSLMNLIVFHVYNASLYRSFHQVNTRRTLMAYSVEYRSCFLYGQRCHRFRSEWEPRIYVARTTGKHKFMIFYCNLFYDIEIILNFIHFLCSLSFSQFQIPTSLLVQRLFCIIFKISYFLSYKLLWSSIIAIKLVSKF